MNYHLDVRGYVEFFVLIVGVGYQPSFHAVKYARVSDSCLLALFFEELKKIKSGVQKYRQNNLKKGY